MDEDSITEQKTWQVSQRGRGRSFHVDGPKTEEEKRRHT